MTIATVTAISGQAWARDAAGNLRELDIGDTLQEGEVLVTAEGARVELDFADSLNPAVIQGEQEVIISADLADDEAVTEEAASALDEDIDALLTAIEEGEGDLLADLDPTAAGAGPGGSAEGGHGFVRLARIVEPLTPLSYEYGLGQFDEVEFPEDQFLAQAAEEEDATPSVGTADLDDDGDTVWESALEQGSGGGVATTGGAFQIDTGSDELALIEVQDAAGNWVAISAGATEVQGIYGVLSVNPDGSWTYTLTEPLDHPLAGETGTSDQLPAETFAVRVTDDDGDVSAPATLTITITDDGPTAVQDGALVAEDTTTVLSGDVLANDTLGADRPESVAFDDTQASYGTFTDNGDGTWSYVLDNDSSAVQALSVGETLTETFDYTLTDADGDTSTATLTVTITGQDDGVTLTGISVGSAEQTVYEANLPAGSDSDAASLTQSGAFSFTAFDELGSLTIAGENLTLAELQALSADSPLEITSDHGTLLLTGFSGDAAGGTLSYTYTLDATVDNATVTGATGTEYLDSFAVGLVDADSSSASASLDIRIVDDAPTAVDDPNASITEDTSTTLTGDVLFNDTLGADRPASVAFDDTQASYGTFTDNGDGTWSYVLDNDSSAVQGLSVGETLTETFAYTLTDADGDTSTATLIVTITGQDDGVTLTGISVGSAEQTVYEANLPAGSETDAAALTQSGVFSFTAVDELGSLTIAGQSLTLIELQALSADSPLEITSDHGTLLLTGFSGDAAGGTLTYTYMLDATVDNDTVTGASGTEYLDSFAVSLVDADGSSASASLDIRIVDDAPTAVDDPDASIAEDTSTTLTGDVLFNDTLGADRPASVAFDDTQASYGTFTDNGDGTWSYVLNNDSSAVQGLSVGETLTETFDYTLTDADGDISTASLTVTITGQDDGVTLTGISVGSAEQTVYEANLPAGSDSDGAALTQSGVFSFTAVDELGSLTIGGEELSLAELQALSLDSPLEITSDFGTLLLTGFSGDAAGGTLSYTYTLDATVDNATVTGATGTEYLDSFAVGLVDADGSSASASLDIRIVDDAPTAVDDPNASITEDTSTTLTGDVLFNDTLGADRPEGVAFDDTQASYGTFTDNGDGTWSYVLDNDSSAVQGLSVGETLTETFDYTLTDADGDTSTATLTVTITGQDDGVTLTGISVGSAEQTVYEANLPAGSDTDSAALTQSGVFSFTAFDELGSLTIAGQSLTLAELQALSADSPLAITTDHGTLLITGFSGDAAGGTLSYTYTLDATVDNDTVSGATGTEYLDSFAVSLVDADGSSASASLDIRIVDDEPFAVNPDTGYLINLVGVSGSLEGIPLDLDRNIEDNYGADQGGTLQLVADSSVPSGYTAGSQDIYYYVSEDGSRLIGSTLAGSDFTTVSAMIDGSYADHVVFELVLNADASADQAQDTYSFTLYQQVDGGVGEFNTSTGSWAISGGNTNYVYYTDTSGNDLPSVLITPTEGAVKVNTTANGVGASGSGPGQDIGSGEAIRVDYVENVAGDPVQKDYDPALADFSFDTHLLVNGAIATFFINNGTSTVRIEAFDDLDYGQADEQDDVGDYIRDAITWITINGTEVLPDGPVPDGYSVDFTGDSVIVSGVADADSIAVFTDTGFTTVEYAYLDGSTFEMAGFGASSYDPGALVNIDFDLQVVDADGDRVLVEDAISLQLSPDDHELLMGTEDADTLEAEMDQASTLVGLEGDDALAGDSGEDILVGGEGDDILSGDSGDDTFIWNLGDEGDAESPSLDTVADFSVGDGDMLDISDMLSGMPDGADLSSFIQAAPSDSGTMLYISTEGSLADGDLSGADQMILLSNVEMGDLSSLQFLQSLIEEGQLEID